MDGEQIARVLQANPVTAPIFKGCFAADRIPSPHALRFPAAIIVNLDRHQYSGSHWVAAYGKGREREVYYFDSFAQPPTPIINDSFFNIKSMNAH